MSYKILNTIGPLFSEKAKEILSTLGEVDYLTSAQEELDKRIDEYDVIIIGLGLNFHEDILAKTSKLKVIATATTGLDHIDINYAKEHGIEVLSLRGEEKFLSTITGTAELAFGLIIDLLRHITHAHNDVQHMNWDREKWRGHNLSGGTLGVVGAGRLGRMMVKYGAAFGMRVLFYDPHVEELEGGKKVTFETLVKESDVISLHVHLLPETENMFNREVFKRMKDTAYLVNTARGKIVNEKDLLTALQEKVIAGYATDVLADELSFTGTRFLKNPLVEYASRHTNCIVVPHIGGMTYESREATDIFIAEKVKNHLQ